MCIQLEDILHNCHKWILYKNENDLINKFAELENSRTALLLLFFLFVDFMSFFSVSNISTDSDC